ncbi:amino acid adenylation domain-containing protein [Actinocorallia sp. API 0066]|uniref:non-ribosomal peptide synthetase n=1 Tax=Actinocorallia sp. API 0066 TaxID=2896846 RepID=UPI001E34DD90|nr:non-ribosomal peptide synthetase [Actinocorallia sp. API 0066]MCD0449345.1 amino acid adenylation domain-containing protein [Actinocorallia sp. API 0066]
MSAPASAERPLNAAQSGVWYAQRLHPASAVFNLGGYLDLRGPLDPALLAAAVARAQGEDDALGLTFAERDGAPAQTFGPVSAPVPAVTDVSGEPDPAAASLAAMRADLAVVADLEHGPLHHDMVFRLGPEHHRWYTRTHHLVRDGHAVTQLCRRVAEHYRALTEGRAASRPLASFGVLLDAADDYAGSAAWRRDAAYWRAHLDGAPVPPPAAAPVHRIARASVRLDPATFTGLRAFATAAGISWHQALLGAAVLHRHLWTGETDVLLSMAVPGRLIRHAGGMTANIVPLRCAVDPAEPAAALAARVAGLAAKAQWHQRYQTGELLRDLGWWERGVRQFGPMVNILTDREVHDLGSAGGPAHMLSTGGTADDLSLTVCRGDAGELRVDVTLDESSSADLAAYGHTFARLVATLGEHPDAPVGDLDLLTPADRARLLTEWTATGDASAAETTLPALVERQAHDRPHAVALIHGPDRLTYGDLNARANRLARTLLARGVRRGDLVGVLLERGLDFAVALLAVVKTGAAYIVLDPDFPDARIAAVTTTSGATTVITHPILAPRLPKATPWINTTTPTNPSDADLGVVVEPGDVACVMFTSGSTGRPKGVMAPHRALVGTLVGQAYAPFGPKSVFLQCSPVSWDGFSLEFWGALAFGGTCVSQPGQRPEPGLIAALAAEHGVTMLQLSSGLFNVMADEYPAVFDTVRVVFTGGEVASGAHVARVLARGSGVAVANAYGPAESMGFTTVFTVPDGFGGEGVPIGKPISAKRAYVLDKRLRPVPVGAVGEVYLGGVGLAHGYLADPAQTGRRFVADPFAADGSRLYRTGDLARWRADGTLEFAGRTDDQVKIRGFRIEPAEVERALLDCPGVAQAVAAAVGEGLVGYAVPEPGSDLDGRELRALLRARLPEHLVPSTVVVLDRLPLTPNGKLDRRALPVPETAAGPAGRAPRDAREEILCGLFAEVLDVPEVGPEDDFFDLGGHSLLAARLAARARTALGAELTIRDVFQHPTVAALAVTLRGDGQAPPPLVAASRPDRLPLSYAQRRLWLVSRLEGASAAYNVPLTVRLAGDLDVAALRAAFTDVAARHEPLRTVVAAEDGEPYQRILNADVPFTHVATAPEDLDAALADAARRPFDLAAEPPLRVTLFDLGGGAHVLLVLLHHIATDGESQRPLFADLAAAYAARRAGRAPDWAPLPVQYADYALWQHAALGDPADPDGVAGRELAFWRETLAGLPEELGLALDRPRPLVAGTEGGAVPVAFGPETGRRVLDLARTERATPFMVLQAALALTLTRLGAGVDVPIGAPVAGRSVDGLGDLVGFFVNTLVLRTDTSGDPSFRELLSRVRAADLDAFAHQEVPFDLVIEALNPVRSLSRHPLFQVCLGLERAAGPAPSLPGLNASPTTVTHSGAAKFDLEFLLTEDTTGLSGAVLYRTDIFDRASVDRITATFTRVVDQVTADPTLTLGTVDVLDPQERTRLLTEWTATGNGTTAETTLPALVEHHARQHPNAIALVYDATRPTSGQPPTRELPHAVSPVDDAARDRPEAAASVGEEARLSYGELNARANRLARLLLARGVRRGDLVGVLLERGLDFAVALLAVLKTGAGYVVLDPDFPDERIGLVVGEAAPVGVVTRAGSAQRLGGPPVVLVDDPGLAGYESADLGVPVEPGDTACVMFTSGSTGRPKGVFAPHRALVGTLVGQAYAPFGGESVFLQCSPVSWDGFSLEFWGALAFGGTCVLQPGQRPEPGLIAALTAEHGVTMLQLSSGLFNVMADEYPAVFDTVRVVFTGGEVASGGHVARVTARGAAVVANAYGPAESMGFTTVFPVPGGFEGGPVPIGAPIGGKRAYVLDGRLRPVPVGAVGEVYLGGVGLAHGYLADPAQTGRRFVADPFAADGSRLYRTGDLARWRADGTLEFAGRTDDQVKIRGFRVELGEVERALLAHPDVAQAAAVAVKDGTSHRLVGYAVPAGDASLDGRDVRALVRRSVPEHLVPSTVVVLDRLPLTPNGKLDRRALPVPETAAPVGRAPRDDRERTLCALFADVLGVPGVGIDDDFFDLGGHSLLAARLTARIRTATATELTLRDIFHSPTPAALAQLLPPDGTAPTPARRPRPALRRRTTSGTLL